MPVCVRHVTLASVSSCTILPHDFIFSQLNVPRSVTIPQDVHLLSGVEGARTLGSHPARRRETNLKISTQNTPKLQRLELLKSFLVK